MFLYQTYYPPVSGITEQTCRTILMNNTSAWPLKVLGVCDDGFLDAREKASWSETAVAAESLVVCRVYTFIQTLRAKEKEAAATAAHV
jgi:hypothetical protein